MHAGANGTKRTQRCRRDRVGVSLAARHRRGRITRLHRRITRHLRDTSIRSRKRITQRGRFITNGPYGAMKDIGMRVMTVARTGGMTLAGTTVTATAGIRIGDSGNS
jgi:hypothetical protein